MFVTSYVADDADQRRPVTFAFNGGPGSSSVWLHLGLLGPRRVLSGDVDNPAPPPWGLADNPESLLAVSDLVFIDPVSTGYSRPAEGHKSEDFLGYTRDIESVGELIRLWTSRNKRWLSPKFLIGESYGTLRAAALAEHLQSRHGLFLNGVVLVSSVLDFATLDENDLACIEFLPTFAAIAWYHGKHPGHSLDEVVTEARAFATDEYPGLLTRGNRLVGDARRAAVAKVAGLTGLSEQYVDQANLRIEHIRFFTELLRDQGLATGRLDGRFTGPLAFGNSEFFDADPSHDFIAGPYAAAWNHYVRAELGYENDLPYEQISMTVGEKWSYKEFEGKHVNVVPKLERAMRQNPFLRVHVAYGWFDGATPFFAAEETFGRLNLPQRLLDRIEGHYYDAGHMMYLHEPSRLQQSADIADFVTRAAQG